MLLLDHDVVSSFYRIHAILRITTIILSFQCFGGFFGKSVSASSSSSTLTSRSTTSSTIIMDDAINNKETLPISIVFSDLDGTLIHYPENNDNSIRNSIRNNVIQLPSSSTGLNGIISLKTFALCRQIRQQQYGNQNNVKLVFVSGMRVSTLMKRLPYLPKADAYCCEAGGRIFYPIPYNNDSNDKEQEARIIIHPIPYQQNNDEDEGDDANTDSDACNADLEPYTLIEDTDWRKRIESTNAAGMDGFPGNDPFGSVPSDNNNNDSKQNDFSNTIPIDQRNGRLWEYATILQKQFGYTIDTVGYTTCFRINRKYQTSEDKFHSLLSYIQRKQQQRNEENHDDKQYNNKNDNVQNDDSMDQYYNHYSKYIATSTNLGCIDFYPIHCGKKNCCEYLAKKFIRQSSDSIAIVNDSNNNSALSNHCLCLCDDDNDIEMALACLHAYIPSISSSSMEQTMHDNLTKFTVTSSSLSSSQDNNDNHESHEGIMDHLYATEEALRLVLERIKRHSQNDSQ